MSVVLSQEELRALQLKVLELLVELDRVCKKYAIEYWIDAGTLLGARRHKGFIPWDDDIDVCMTRENYDKFVEMMTTVEKSKKFFLQTAETDPYYYKRSIPCRFRLNNTELIEKSDAYINAADYRMHQGIFLDIFPFDKYSKNPLIRFPFERYLGFLYVSKTFGQYAKYIKPLSKRIVAWLVHQIFSWDFLEKRKKKLIKKLNAKTENYGWGVGVETPFNRKPNDVEDIFPLSQIEFEGNLYSCPANVDLYLRKMYGEDYMTPPKEQDRHFHYYSVKMEIE